VQAILDDLTKVHFKARLDEMIDVSDAKMAEDDTAGVRHQLVLMLGRIKAMCERILHSLKGGQPLTSDAKAFREVKAELVPLHSEMPGA
jgi:hypothetical protein